MFVNVSVISSMFSIIICIMIFLLSDSFSGALEENFKTTGILWTPSFLYIKNEKFVYENFSDYVALKMHHSK